MLAVCIACAARHQAAQARAEAMIALARQHEFRRTVGAGHTSTGLGAGRAGAAN